MEPLKEFKDFLWLPYLCARLTGIDPKQERGTFRFNIQIVALIIAITDHAYLMIGELIYFQQHLGTFTSLLEATKAAAYIAYGANTNTKFLAVLSDLKRLRNVLQTTELLYPKTDRDKLAYRVNENFWPRSIYMLVVLYFLSGWIVYFLPGFKFVYEYLSGAEEFSYETPFWVAHPFDYRTPFRWIVAYLSEVWGGHLCVCSNIGIDVVLCCLSRQMSMHFKYIGHEIERFCPTGKPEDSVFLAKLIERHQLIFKLCLDLNEIFGVSLVFNFISSAGIICLSAFQITFEGPGVEFAKFCCFFTSCLGQLFIVCYFGDELIACSSSISDSVYHHQWYKGNHSYQKQLVILIQRCQKPAILYAKGFSVVNLLTFKEVTSMSYRIFALLRTFHGEN